MNWNLRPARAGDASAIRELVDLAYRVEDEFVVGNRTDEEDIPGLISRDAFLLAESPARELEGAVYIRCAPPRGYFGMLAVHPVAQGHGLGSLLVRAAERYCRDRKCTEMDLSVINLRGELLSWYTRLGYAACGTDLFAVPTKLRQPAHFVLMTRSLVTQPTEETR